MIYYLIENIFILDCKTLFYTFNAFIKHICKHNPNYYTCGFCQCKNLKCSEAVKHLLGHGIGYYECLFCLSSFDKLEQAKNHLADCHPTKPLYIIARVSFSSQVSEFEI